MRNAKIDEPRARKRAAAGVLKGGLLEGNDSTSFDNVPIESEQDWKKLQEQLWVAVNEYSELLEAMPVEQLCQPFVDGKYGNYYRNIKEMIEHSHYHLGKVALFKCLIAK